MDVTIAEQAKQIRVLKREIARLRKQTQWQPIHTAPKGSLLLYFPPEQTQDEWITIGAATGRYRKPTHWMPLPKPPATEGGK